MKKTLFLSIVLICVLFGVSSVAAAREPQQRFDVIELEKVHAFGAPQKAPVLFLHDRHTEALGGTVASCALCHTRNEQSGQWNYRFSPIFAPSGKLLTGKALMDAYHSGCGNCHAETHKVGRFAGPLSNDMCVTCHNASPGVSMKIASSPMDGGGFYSMHDFMLCTKSLTYILMGLGLFGFCGYWLFLSGKDEDVG